MATQLLHSTQLYEEHFAAQGLLPPGLDEAAWPEPELPGSGAAARADALQTSLLLQDALRGPLDTIHGAARNVSSLLPFSPPHLSQLLSDFLPPPFLARAS